MKRFLVLVTTTLIISCGGSNDEDKVDLDEVQAVILENQLKWESSGLTDYSFTYLRSPGDCPMADELPAMDINVEDDAVVSVYYAGTSQQIDRYDAPTINDIFQLLVGSIHKAPIKFSSSKNEDALPLFDAELGYPISFFIDDSSRECDAIYNRITEFK